MVTEQLYKYSISKNLLTLLYGYTNPKLFH